MRKKRREKEGNWTLLTYFIMLHFEEDNNKDEEKIKSIYKLFKFCNF